MTAEPGFTRLKGLWNQHLKKVPLLYALLVPFLSLIVISSGLIGYIAFRNSQKFVRDATRRFRIEITARIGDHLGTFLIPPHRATELFTNIIDQGLLDPTDQDALVRYFKGQIDVCQSINSIYFGNPNGGMADCGREGVEESTYMMVTDDFAKGPLVKYALDVNGNRSAVLSKVMDFDVTKRPWYITAKEKEGAAWSPVYILSTGQDMAIAASRPVYDGQKNLMGVVSVDIFLSRIGFFLKHLEIGKTGQAFIIERSGLMIATSTDEKPFTESADFTIRRRLNASESVSLLVRRAVEALQKNEHNLQDITTVEYLEFEIDGRRQYLQVAPIEDKYGLDWLILVVIPESDFLSDVNADRKVSIALMIASLSAALLVGIFTARSITRPIFRLNIAARELAKGDGIRTLPDNFLLYELSELTGSFNWMAGKLQQTIRELKSEIDERRQAQQALRASEEQYRELIENVGEAIVVVQHGMFKFFNPRAQDLVGYSSKEMFATPFIEFVHPADQSMVHKLHLQRMNGIVDPVSYSFRIVRKSGETRWVELKTVLIEWEKKTAALNFIIDITERKYAEDRIAASLREKEILLKEIHHRVKNNMQVISSLLNLQYQKTEDQQVKNAVAEAQSRVRSISLVHEGLYQSPNLAEIDFQLYLEHLVEEIGRLFSLTSDKLKIFIHARKVKMGVKDAVPCGIIINELITNTIKHGFPVEKSGNMIITVEYETTDLMKIIVTDDGVGLPENFDPSNIRTLGIPIIIEIVEGQLEGRWELKGNDGVCWTIRWPYSRSWEE